jgi:nickel-type superoxide dismutase maturation protease
MIHGGNRTPLPREVPAVQLLLWALGRRFRVRVRGASMEPTLLDGDEVLVATHAYRRRRPNPGDVVLTRHPIQSDIKTIKRVSTVDESGLTLLGDNPAASTDSRSYGRVPLDRLLGRVVLVLPRGGDDG